MTDLEQGLSFLLIMETIILILILRYPGPYFERRLAKMREKRNGT